MLGGDGVGSRKEGSGASHRLSFLLSLMLLFAVGRFGGGLQVVSGSGVDCFTVRARHLPNLSHIALFVLVLAWVVAAVVRGVSVVVCGDGVEVGVGNKGGGGVRLHLPYLHQIGFAVVVGGIAVVDIGGGRAGVGSKGGSKVGGVSGEFIVGM